MLSSYRRWRYQQDVLGTLYSIMYLYPRGVKQIPIDYPALKSTIQNYRKNEHSATKAGVFIAGILIANLYETLRQQEREVIREQISHFDFASFKDVMARRIRGEDEPIPDVAHGTLMGAMALIMVERLHMDGAIEKDIYDTFISEILGALHGKSSDERASERLGRFTDELFDVPIICAGENDRTESLPSNAFVEVPEFSGTETKVRLVRTLTGIAMIRADDGRQITEKRALKQEDLELVPHDAGICTFVNLHTRTEGLHSCIIAGDDNEVYGSKRAFWWALARVNVVNTDRKATGHRMTQLAVAAAHTAARTMWDIAIEKAGSIDDMRDTFVLMKNRHFEVINKMIGEAENEATKLGLEIALAMVLATQSEDDKLERFAFERFRRFLWQPGEEPKEFYSYS